jgi:hypothetical protein
MFELNGKFSSQFIIVLAMCVHLKIIEPNELSYLFSEKTEKEIVKVLWKKVQDAQYSPKKS